MPEPTQSNPESGSGDLADEFRNLGENLKTFFQTAWESEERKKLQQEIEAGMAELGKSLSQAASEFKAGPAGQQLKSDFEDLHERVRSGEVENKIRAELLSVLRTVNTELEKAFSPKPPPDNAETDNQSEV
jgi:predicted component of type VI protein secretion system